MQVKLLSLPFHWLHPSAPAKYLGCRASIPVYDPDAIDRTPELVRAAQLVSFDAAVGSVKGRRYRGPKCPKRVLIPTVNLILLRKDVGNGRRLARFAVNHLGFRSFSVADLATKPFATCQSEAANCKAVKKLETLCQ